MRLITRPTTYYEPPVIELHSRQWQGPMFRWLSPGDQSDAASPSGIYNIPHNLHSSLMMNHFY